MLFLARLAMLGTHIIADLSAMRSGRDAWRSIGGVVGKAVTQ